MTELERDYETRLEWLDKIDHMPLERAEPIVCALCRDGKLSETEQMWFQHLLNMYMAWHDAVLDRWRVQMGKQ